MNSVIVELDENSPRAEQPLNAKIQLKPHQLAQLHACRAFEHGLAHVSHDEFMRSRLGVIGDKVGAGKSYVALSLMLSPLPDIYNSDRDVLNFANNTVQIGRRHKQRLVDSSLLVIPHNLVRQWQDYIEAYVPPGTRTLMVGRTRVLENLDDINNYDIVVVTNTLYASIAKLSDGVRWKRIVFDEVDSIKIINCTFIDSCTYWFVTASYNNVIHPLGKTMLDRATNRYVEMASGMRMSGFVRNLFNELHKVLEPPHTLSTLIVKNKDAFVDLSANLPPLSNHIIKCCQSREINILHGLVDHTIIQRLNANDVRGALSYISPVRRQTESNIIATLIESLDRKARNISVKIEYHRSLDYDDPALRDAETARLDVKRKAIMSSISAIQERISSSGTCPICYDDIDQKCIVPCCQNAFCIRCITRWLSQTDKCPLCKGNSSIRDMFVVSAEADVVQSSSSCTAAPVLKSKIDNLAELVNRFKEGGRKVIIFSAYDNTFNVVVPILIRENVTYECLNGTGAHISLVTRRYKEANLNVLLANACNFGSGLNLENTTDIIMFHRFDSEVERQVIGRAQRPGRTLPLNVWYLLNENETLD